MKLSKYIFFQFLPSFLFGFFLFLFVLVLDRLFDLLDLIVNKGIGAQIVGKLFLLIVPTVLRLTIPMAIILACLVTFGRLTEENQMTAIRTAGIPLTKVLWTPFLFAFLLSILLLHLNSNVAPRANQAFIKAYENLVQAEPLLSIDAHKFFAIRNVRFFANDVDKDKKELKNLFVYQLSEGSDPPERIFAKTGTLQMEEDNFRLFLRDGQLQKFDPRDPKRLLHVTFGVYNLLVPFKKPPESISTRFRNLTTEELNKQVEESKNTGVNPAPIKAEMNLRIALAFAPVCLILCGIPLASSLHKGSKSFGFGVSIVVIFFYYLLLVLGLTLAEKDLLDPRLSLWLANDACLVSGSVLFWRMLKR